MHEATRYLKNRDGVGAEVRAAVRATLETAWRDGERVLLLGHSLGSVIAYDTLWELTHVHRSKRRGQLAHDVRQPARDALRAALVARARGRSARRGIRTTFAAG